MDDEHLHDHELLGNQKQSRIWGFTLNNYTPEEVEMVKTMDMTGILYMCFQTEVAPTTGTPHLQGMFSFPGRGRRFNGVKALPGMARARLDTKSKGAWVNRVYCTKQDTRAIEGYEFFEAGEVPVPQGRRTDIQDIKKVIDETGSLRAALNEAHSFQQLQAAKMALTLMDPPLRDGIQVRWYWGATGTGKTRAAYEESGANQPGADVWVSADTLQWWDGYDGHKNVIIDDYRRNACTFVDLLKILDRYRKRVPVKGGFVPLCATNFWITAPKPPDVMWEGRTEEELGQLLRRIHVIREFKDVADPPPGGAGELRIEPEAWIDGNGKLTAWLNFPGEPPGEPEVGLVILEKPTPFEKKNRRHPLLHEEEEEKV
jgi:hypothetical protein